MSKKQVEILKNIFELIEDKQFPARRIITDYIFQLVAEYAPGAAKEMEEYMDGLFDEKDKQQKL